MTSPRLHFSIFGSNTGVGKTLVSAGVIAAAVRRARPTLYLKPVQTGFPRDADGALVARMAGCAAAVPHVLGPHAARAAGTDPTPAAPTDAPLVCQTLFAWNTAIGPHLAAEREGRGVADVELMRATSEVLDAHGSRFALVETAGGVASPAPSGTLQCDLLSSLALPALLVGDGALGGISSTICASEALSSRGIQVAAVAMLDGGLENETALRSHLHPVPVTVLPPLRDSEGDPPVVEWLSSTQETFDSLLDQLEAWHAQSQQ
tara:strand:+ start:249 stop:1037 length:789 start_codon:yes stop_codon:yes gene_type:complete